MKKIINILFLLFLFPNLVLACPHVDENGEKHFLFFNDDYTENIRMYPKKNYLYSQTMNEDYSATIEEAFGFPLVMSKLGYYENYRFVDESLLAENWQDQDIKTNIEGIELLELKSVNYNLKIGLENTFKKSNNWVTTSTYQMFYNVNLPRLDNRVDLMMEVEKSELNLVNENILNIDAEFFIMDDLEHNYATSNIVIDKYYDDIEVSIEGETELEVMVVNLEDDLIEGNIIECSYENGIFNFTIKENGAYAIVEKKTLPEEIIRYEDDEEEGKGINKIYFLIPFLLIGIGIFVSKKL